MADEQVVLLADKQAVLLADNQAVLLANEPVVLLLLVLGGAILASQQGGKASSRASWTASSQSWGRRAAGPGEGEQLVLRKASSRSWGKRAAGPGVSE